MFYILSRTNFAISITLNLSSVNASHLDRFKILSFGKGLSVFCGQCRSRADITEICSLNLYCLPLLYTEQKWKHYTYILAKRIALVLFLAHLSTKCSWWAIGIVLCPASVVRHPSSTFYLVYALEATVLVGYSWKLVRMFVSMKSRTSSKMGHVGSKTRSLGQILEKPCVRSRGHILSRILMEVGQDVCLDNISDEFKNGSRGVKN